MNDMDHVSARKKRSQHVIVGTLVVGRLGSRKARKQTIADYENGPINDHGDVRKYSCSVPAAVTWIEPAEHGTRWKHVLCVVTVKYVR